MVTINGHTVRTVFFCVATAMLCRPAAAQVVAALPQITAPAPQSGPARPIAAWIEFCRTYAAECAVDLAEPAEIALTPKIWSLVNGINRRVNASIRAVTDEEHWGLADKWDLAEDGMGDCEDFQLLKRKLLAEAGLPRRAMRMTVVLDEKREGHAVLMIRTNRGDFVLDNKTNVVSSWFETGYVFVKRESQAAIGWTSLGGAVSPTVTANR